MADEPLHETDVVVIGAGVVGTAVARLLSHHSCAVTLLDGAPDVGTATSKANTAILHTGFDATPGSLEAGLVRRGYQLFRDHAPRVGIAVEEVGAVLVAWDDEQVESLVALEAKAHANEYAAVEVISAETLYEIEPKLGAGATGGMLVPGEHIIDPWAVPLAFAREAIANGVVWLPRFHVDGLAFDGDTTVVSAADGRSVRARFVVNAAGLFSDQVHELAGLAGFAVTPRRGELIVFDKLARPLLNRIVLPVPTPRSKGVLVAPTVFGNVMVGPTAEDLTDKSATGSSRAGLDALLAQARRILPALTDEEVTAVYAGLRAATEHSDYQVTHHPDLRYVCLGGIRSTGLTSSMALAEESLDRLISCGLSAVPRPPDALSAIAVADLGEASTRPYQRGGSGPIVCHCERVTRDEITAACNAVPPAVDLDGVRRRTRAVMGRCQGFYCLAEVCSVAAEATGRPLGEWLGGP